MRLDIVQAALLRVMCFWRDLERAVNGPGAKCHMTDPEPSPPNGPTMSHARTPGASSVVPMTSPSLDIIGQLCTAAGSQPVRMPTFTSYLVVQDRGSICRSYAKQGGRAGLVRQGSCTSWKQTVPARFALEAGDTND